MSVLNRITTLIPSHRSPVHTSVNKYEGDITVECARVCVTFVQATALVEQLMESQLIG